MGLSETSALLALGGISLTAIGVLYAHDRRALLNSNPFSYVLSAEREIGGQAARHRQRWWSLQDLGHDATFRLGAAKQLLRKASAVADRRLAEARSPMRTSAPEGEEDVQLRDTIMSIEHQLNFVEDALKNLRELGTTGSSSLRIETVDCPTVIRLVCQQLTS